MSLERPTKALEEGAPLSERINERVSGIGESVRRAAEEMVAQGYPESAIATVFAIYERIGGLIWEKRPLDPDRTRDARFLNEVNDAVRAIANGLTLGLSEDRRRQQSFIVNHPGLLADELRAGLRRAVGNENVGPLGGIMTTDTNV